MDTKRTLTSRKPPITPDHGLIYQVQRGTTGATAHKAAQIVCAYQLNCEEGNVEKANVIHEQLQDFVVRNCVQPSQTREVVR